MAHTPDIRRRSDRVGRRMDDVIVRGQPNHGANTLTKSLPGGTIVDALPPRVRVPGSDHPWKLSLGSETPYTIKVRPGILYLGSTPISPKINNVLLTEEPPPTLAITVGTFDIAIRFQVDAIFGTQTITPGTIRYITAGYLSNANVSIVAVPNTAPPPGETNVGIDYYLGTSTPGVFYVALGRVKRESGAEGALTILSQYWKTNISAALMGDGSMFYHIR